MTDQNFQKKISLISKSKPNIDNLTLEQMISGEKYGLNNHKMEEEPLKNVKTSEVVKAFEVEVVNSKVSNKNDISANTQFTFENKDGNKNWEIQKIEQVDSDSSDYSITS